MSDIHDRVAKAANAIPQPTPSLEQLIDEFVLVSEARSVKQPGVADTLRKRRGWLLARAITKLRAGRYAYIDDTDAGELHITWTRSGVVKISVRDLDDTGKDEEAA